MFSLPPESPVWRLLEAGQSCSAYSYTYLALRIEHIFTLLYRSNGMDNNKMLMGTSQVRGCLAGWLLGYGVACFLSLVLLVTPLGYPYKWRGSGGGRILATSEISKSNSRRSDFHLTPSSSKGLRVKITVNIPTFDYTESDCHCYAAPWNYRTAANLPGDITTSPTWR